MRILSRSNLIWFIVIGLPLIAAIIGYLIPNPLFPSKLQMNEFLSSYGIWAPIIFMAIATIPIVITPLNHAVFALMAGALFGFWNGLLINWLTKTIGTAINFYLGRWLGKTVVSKFISQKDFNRYDRLINAKNSLFILFLVYLVPVLSNDNLSYVIGLSTIKAKKFIAVVTFSHLGSMFIYTYIGTGYSFFSPVFLFFVLFLIGAGLIANKFIKQINYLDKK